MIRAVALDGSLHLLHGLPSGPWARHAVTRSPLPAGSVLSFSPLSPALISRLSLLSLPSPSPPPSTLPPLLSLLSLLPLVNSAAPWSEAFGADEQHREQRGGRGEREQGGREQEDTGRREQTGERQCEVFMGPLRWMAACIWWIDRLTAHRARSASSQCAPHLAVGETGILCILCWHSLVVSVETPTKGRGGAVE